MVQTIKNIVVWLKQWFYDKDEIDAMISGGGSVTVDDALSTTSTNPVQNKVITTSLNGKTDVGHTHTLSNISDLTVEQRTITVTSPTSGSDYFSGGTREIKAEKWGKIVHLSINFYGVNCKASGTSVDTTIGTLPDGWKPKADVGRVKTVGSTSANLNYSQAGINANGNIFIRVAYTTALSNVTFRCNFTFITA